MDLATADTDRLVLSDFSTLEPRIAEGVVWHGFSDRVMGGVSDATLSHDAVGGAHGLRLTGHVTRDHGGGFVQMAADLGGTGRALDASSYAGVEALIFGNGEDYNIHIRTADCSWYDESYRATVHAGPQWQRIRIRWDAFEPHGVHLPLDPSHLRRIGLLGWMREFDADLALGELSLFRE